METKPNNFDSALKGKFENFAPPPPAHIWEGVAAGIGGQAKPAAVFNLWRGIGIAVSILVLLGLAFWWFMPRNEDTAINDLTEEINVTQEDASGNASVDESLLDSSGTSNVSDETSDVSDETSDVSDEKSTVSDETANSNSLDLETTDPLGPNGSDTKTVSKSSSDPDPAQTLIVDQSAAGQANANENYLEGDYAGAETGNTSEDHTPQSIFGIAAYGASLENDLPAESMDQNELPPTLIAGTSSETAGSAGARGWSHGFYFTPEAFLNDFDSVTILPAYSLNYEPSYHFNNHLFMRFGVGLQYARDRGFVRMNYDRVEVVGSYEDVYDVTFDSIGGEVVPTYHTKTTEVWEEVNHIEISEVVNSYLYLQVPALIGYHNKGKKINWFFYGGPAFNLLISKWIGDPMEGIEGATNITLQSNLPERSAYYLQAWVGAGIEYKFNKQLGLALEPTYRYYFNQVYTDEQYKVGLSSFGLRVGLVYKIK